jgi:hypothetical protein
VAVFTKALAARNKSYASSCASDSLASLGCVLQSTTIGAGKGKYETELLRANINDQLARCGLCASFDGRMNNTIWCRCLLLLFVGCRLFTQLEDIEEFKDGEFSISANVALIALHGQLQI